MERDVVEWMEGCAARFVLVAGEAPALGISARKQGSRVAAAEAYNDALGQGIKSLILFYRGLWWWLGFLMRAEKIDPALGPVD